MLKHGRKFERMGTDVPGIYIRKIPPSVIEEAYLAVEINPIGKDGLPTNKIGIIIRNTEQLSAIRAILSESKVDEIVQAIEGLDQS